MRDIAIFRHRLNANMRCPRREMRAQPGLHRCSITMQHHGINEAIAAAIGELRFRETKPQPIIHVIRQHHIAGEFAPPEGARAHRIVMKFLSDLDILSPSTPRWPECRK